MHQEELKTPVTIADFKHYKTRRDALDNVVDNALTFLIQKKAIR
jgi:hypothetical protein